MTIKCPKCNKETSIDISKSINEEGEVFMCEHCKYPFWFTNK